VATVGDSRSIVGTEGYLPPEGPGNPQADLYSLGKLLYEVSTGLSRGEYPRLPPNLGTLPDASELLEFNEVLLKACTKDTAQRYRQADDLLADLALLERGDSVKRLRRLERHHVLFKRVGVGLLVVGLLVSSAWWESWRARRVAHRHLARLHVNEGTQRMVQGDYAAALPWLVGALQLDSGDAARERAHRTRIASVLQRCPLPVAHFAVPGSEVVSADLSPDGAVVVTAHQDWSVRLWDVHSGKQMQQLPHKFPVSVCQFLPSGDRLLTVTMGQQAQVWDWARPEVAPLTLTQAQAAGAVGYGVNLNESLGAAYLSKRAYVYPRFHEFTEAFENLTLSLKLIGKGEDLFVKNEVRRTGGGQEILDAGEFLDTPAADALDRGTDNPAAPIWGQVLLILEDSSSGSSPGQSGQVILDNVKLRRYPSGARPPPWRVLDDFSSGSASNWIVCALAEEERSCQVVNGQVVLSCSQLPSYQSAGGALLYRQPLEISRSHTLEVEVDLVSARAPHPMVSLTLGHYEFDSLTVPDRAFIAHGRWLATTRWDAPLRLFDLERAPAPSMVEEERDATFDLGRPGHVYDMDFSPDTNYVAVVESTHELSIWDLGTRREVVTADTNTTDAKGARFSPDSRFLAVGYGEGLKLIRTADWQVAQTLMPGSSFTLPRFAPMGYRLAAVRNEQNLVVWDLDNLPEPLATFPHPSAIRRIAFSPDGRYLATSAGDDKVRIWDVVRGEAFGPPLPGALGRFSPDGTQLLVIGSEGGAWLWDLSRIVDDTLPVPILRAERLVASSADRTLTAEITGQGVTVNTLSGQHLLAHPVPLRRVAFTRGNEYLITEGSDLLARVWDVPTLTLARPPRPVRYEAMLATHPQPNLPVEKRELRTLSALAALLGQQKPDGTGGMIPVDEAERARIFGELQQSYPAEFTVHTASRSRWHRNQAEAAESAMDWDAAVFHWERCLEEKAEIPVESRLAYARQAAEAVRKVMLQELSRWSVKLPRPPWASGEMLDLGNLYTQRLGELFEAGKPGTSFRGLASGVQVLGGTGFDVRGIVNLKVTNHVRISVGRACQRLHFLHAASQATWGREIAATYHVAYAGGMTESVTLRNPDELPPYTSNHFNEVWAPPGAKAKGNVRSEPAWAGYASSPGGQKVMLYLTQTTWTLPTTHHGEVVESIELRAGPGQSAPLVFAITIE
jgi:WD40 repeat protein